MALTFEPLDAARHNRAAFTCGKLSLDNYMRQQAAQNVEQKMAAVHVYVESTDPLLIPIVGYYTLSAAEVRLDQLSEQDRKKLPRYPVPGMRIGRLAVAREHQRKGVGELLLGDAVDRCLGLRRDAGIKILVVDADGEDVVGFYEKYGFRRTTENAMTFYLPLP
jgi:ribosomal protein S18 acetylase RimI-like enzyme